MSGSPREPELTARERQALESVPTVAPPADFTDRVVRAAAGAPPARRRGRRVAFVLAAAAVLGVGAAASWYLATAEEAVAPQPPAPPERPGVVSLGDQGEAWAADGAALTWREDAAGKLHVEQGRGLVRYRFGRTNQLTIDTGDHGVLHVEGLDFEVANGLDPASVVVTSRGGTLAVRNGLGEVAVRAGQPVTASATGAPVELGAPVFEALEVE